MLSIYKYIFITIYNVLIVNVDLVPVSVFNCCVFSFYIVDGLSENILNRPYCVLRLSSFCTFILSFALENLIIYIPDQSLTTFQSGKLI